MLRWTTSAFFSSASATIVRNLKIRNVVPFAPRRTWRKNTGPRDSSLMQSATAANSGARKSRPSVAAARSNARLRMRDERESLIGLSPTSGIPSSVCTSAPPPKTSKYRGTMSICTSRSRIARMFASTASWESFEKAKITRSTPCSDDAFAKAVGSAEQQREPLRELVVELGRAIVDEAHEVDAVLAMVRQLEGELLADVPRADDDCVLLVAGQVAAEHPRDGAQGRDQDDRGEPEDAESAEHRLHEVRGDAEEGEDPDADRDASEDTDDVVDRRVVGPLLVAVVEPLEAQEKKPAGNREEECHVLETRG